MPIDGGSRPRPTTKWDDMLATETQQHGTLADDDFRILPLSVLNTRSGPWQERRRRWLALGIQSELGRGDGAVQNYRCSGITASANPASQQHLADATLAGRDDLTGVVGRKTRRRS